MDAYQTCYNRIGYYQYDNPTRLDVLLWLVWVSWHSKALISHRSLNDLKCARFGGKDIVWYQRRRGLNVLQDGVPSCLDGQSSCSRGHDYRQ